MNIATVEENIQKLTKNFSKKTFVYDLLIAYGVPKSSVARLKSGTGTYNLSKVTGEILWKKKLFFKEVTKGDLHDVIDDAKSNSTIMKQDPRFLIVTDWKTFLALDTKTSTTLDVELSSLNKHFDFFLPWAGLEKVSAHIENPADVKAAEKMAKLYDQILSDNPKMDAKEVHSLNVFLSRLLFCYFAEDTGIFEAGLFTSSVASHTAADGSDLDTYLNKLFEVLNTKERKKYPQYLQAFPYVNGGLLAKKMDTPVFTARSRKILIECGELNWSEINPDIFGSMIQAVVHPDQRSDMGMHYTSVPNIMKVIEPLFLRELYEEFEKSKNNEKRLEKLLKRICSLQIFDPACGSGNFLIVAYKELRKLEILIIQSINKVKKQTEFNYSSIFLNQFYGIEIDDFAHEIAILSLWLAEHQMNLMFKEYFGDTLPTLPLKDGAKISYSNALTTDWKKVCPISKDSEIYIMGNPPYLGSRNQTKKQKAEQNECLKSIKKSAKLDYISCWFFLASEYIKYNNAKFAFVSTNSICQGEQVPILWRTVLSTDKEIFFTHQSFPWENSAKNNAGVSVVIIGIQNKTLKPKVIFNKGLSKNVAEINPYLAGAETVYIDVMQKPISNLPEMVRGNYTGCCNALILTEIERQELISSSPASEKFIKKLIGSDEFISGKNRFCLWISDEMRAEAMEIPDIKSRILKVKNERLNSTDVGQQKIASRSHQFREFNTTTKSSIIVPVVSSERREYIPCGFIKPDEIVPNSAQVIYDCENWVFSVISSKIHTAWVKAIAGRLDNRIRYSSTICYNTFPLPPLNENQKKDLQKHVYRILEIREQFSEKQLAELYDPEKMPIELKEVHHLLDQEVERCYRSKPFADDEDRLTHLFKLYKIMTKEDEHAKHS